LVDAIHEGVALLTWQQDSFAYADSLDEGAARYRGLRFGQQVPFGQEEQSGLLVKPEAAMRQFRAEQAATAAVICGTPGSPPPALGPAVTTPKGPPTTQPAAAVRPKRFYGSVPLNSQRVGRDAGRIAEEIIQHLALQPGATVEVTLEIQARMPAGAPENIVRIVTENAHTLKFTAQAFEPE
jgi:hypothetical protein